MDRATRGAGALAVLVVAALGCGSSESPPEPRVAGVAQPPERRATARLPEQASQQRTASARRLPPPRRPPVVAALQRTTPPNLTDALLAMPAEEALRRLEEIEGPFDGAHYVFQRGSETEVEGEVRPVEGGLSVLDCVFLDEGDPSRGRALRIAGVRLEGAPDVFEGRIEVRRTLPVLGRELPRSGRWRDLRESRGALTGFGRTLDAALDEATPDEAWIWTRELTLDPDAESDASFHDAGDPCPTEMTLHLVVHDAFEHWALIEGDGELHPAVLSTESEAPLARATLVALQVSTEPELLDPAQRALHGSPPSLPRAPATLSARPRPPH